MPSSSPRKSTNVRIKTLRALFAVLNRVPAIGALCAERLFFTPPRPRAMKAPLAGGQRLEVHVDGVRVVGRRYGQGPAVVLLHGWGGRRTQLEALVEPLLAVGQAVVTFDAPGHGDSGGTTSSLVHFTRALRKVLAVTGPARAVVAHSLGGPAVALALEAGAPIERAVFVGPPADPVSWTWAFARMLGIADEVMDRMRRRTERRLGFQWSDLHVPTIARRLTTPLLVVHDQEDAEVPWSEGAAIARAWPAALLLTTRGLGHRRILRDPGVVSAVVRFVAEEGSPSRVSETERLEAELYERDTRAWGSDLTLTPPVVH